MIQVLSKCVNSWLPRALVAAGVSTLLVPMSGQASDGLISFVGAVTENGCSVRVNGVETGSGTIALPIVGAAAFDQPVAPNGTAAGTFFSISLSACTASQADTGGGSPTRVAVYFEAGPNVDPVTSALLNLGTSNVEVKIFQASEASVVGQQITPGISGAGQPESQSMADPGTQYYYVVYSTPGNGAATPGTVSTSITYSLIYQ